MTNVLDSAVATNSTALRNLNQGAIAILYVAVWHAGVELRSGLQYSSSTRFRMSAITVLSFDIDGTVLGRSRSP
jgi:hypothetical protein